jgi:hypothetical protein
MIKDMSDEEVSDNEEGSSVKQGYVQSSNTSTKWKY